MWSGGRYLVAHVKLRLISYFLSLTATLTFAQSDDYEQAPIRYSDSRPNDGISKLQERLNSRELEFTGSERETLDMMLKELKIPVESQLLVFSKTSVQRVRISPRNPRALYFNDTCYVGWVPGGIIEVASMDPQLGPVFYTFDPMERSGKTVQRFRRDPSCLSCHAGNFTRDIPGVFARSVFPEPTGSPIFSAGSAVIDYTTPFDQRWGGWYVTGRHGAGRHRGNAFAKENGDSVMLDMEGGANLDSLEQFIDPSTYLMPTSDIASLLVFEHQLAVHQAFTRANHECRRMLEYQRGLQESFKQPFTEEPSFDSVKSVFKHNAEHVLDVLLYKDEAPLPDGGVRGGAFVAAYHEGGRRTADGRSLRDLDLKSRVAKYRCSHLIYSDQFKQLPKPLLRTVLDRLGRILHDPKPEERYSYLADEERKSIAEIIRETAPELAASWPK
jgi:hypothetical protein